MALRIVRLGADRAIDEGTRIGTVRRPPRGVPKEKFAAENWYDVWFPTLAPSAETLKLGQDARTDQDWMAFTRKYKAEMAQAEPNHALNLLAALSRASNFSVGCYCTSEDRCHRAILRQLLEERGATFA